MQPPPKSSDKVCPKCKGVFSGDSLYCPDDGTPLNIGTILGGAAAVDDYLGLVVQGDIAIEELIGTGAMGRVYRAFQKGVDRHVAVKVLHRELSTNKEIVARFHREAHVASRLQHPHVVQVYLTGEMPDGAMYIVMEYLDGMSLQSALAAAGGAMPVARAIHVILQLAEAVGEAHAQGIVHRDLKPENVMLVRRGLDEDFVKVLDFGIARVNWGDQSMATQQGLIFGTARYISPEGAQGEAVGPESDVYAIATLLYQMLAGETPFDGDQAVGILIRQIGDPPPDLLTKPRAAAVPPLVARVVMKNLAKSKMERAPNARALARMLLDAVRESGLRLEEMLLRPSLLGPLAYDTDPAARDSRSSEPHASTARAGGALDPSSAIPLPVRTAPLPKMPAGDPRGATAKWIPEGAKNFASPTPPVVEDFSRASPVPVSPGRPPSQVLPTVVGAEHAGTPHFGHGSGDPPHDLAYRGSAPSYPEAGGYPPEHGTMSETMGTARRTRMVTIVTVVLCFAIGLVGAGLVAKRYGLLGPKPPVVVPTVTAPPVTVPSVVPAVSGPEMISLPPLAGSTTGPIAAPTDPPKITLTVESIPPVPAVGQTVELVARVQASRRAKRLDSGVFVVKSGSSAEVTIPAQQDANGFHASYMVPSLGQTVVTFSVRFDNFRAKTVKTLGAGGGGGGGGGGSPIVAPRPTGSVQWM